MKSTANTSSPPIFVVLTPNNFHFTTGTLLYYTPDRFYILLKNHFCKWLNCEIQFREKLSIDLLKNSVGRPFMGNVIFIGILMLNKSIFAVILSLIVSDEMKFEI